MFMLRMITLDWLDRPTWPLKVGLVPEHPMIVLFEPIVAVPCPRLPLTKITAAVVPLAAVLNWASVVTSWPAAEPPPVVPPLSDAQPTGAGVPAMNDGTAHGVAACSTSSCSSGSDSAQPVMALTAQIINLVRIAISSIFECCVVCHASRIRYIVSN